MKNFKDLGIKVESPNFSGDKIKIDRVLNTQIEVLDYKIGPSTQKVGTECLTLQIRKEGQMHIIFTGARGLMEAIKQVSKADFPFKATIVKNDQQYAFT